MGGRGRVVGGVVSELQMRAVGYLLWVDGRSGGEVAMTMDRVASG